MGDKYEYTLSYTNNDEVLTSTFRADKTFEELLELLIRFLEGCAWDKNTIENCLVTFVEDLKISKGD